MTNCCQAILEVEKLRDRGATHLVLTWHTSWWLDYYGEFAQHLSGSADLLESPPEFTIYKLSPAVK
jgi:hypothetical protein